MHVPEEVFQRDVSSERIRFIYFYDGRLFRSLDQGQTEIIGGVISAKVGSEKVKDLKNCIKYTLPNKKVRSSDLIKFLLMAWGDVRSGLAI
jgi:hypothetical protein